MLVFGKQIDNLKTNHRVCYVSPSLHFTWAGIWKKEGRSWEGKRERAGWGWMDEANECVCGIGSLCSYGLEVQAVDKDEC